MPEIINQPEECIVQSYDSMLTIKHVQEYQGRTLECALRCYEPLSNYKRKHQVSNRRILEKDAAHYGYTIEEGPIEIREDESTLATVEGGGYFSISNRETTLHKPSRHGSFGVWVVSRAKATCLFQQGIELEESGRQQYINGCTATNLFPAVHQGEPCLHALWIPPNTKQDPHTHPTIRFGIVTEGSGTFETETSAIPLEKHSVFAIPPNTVHSFKTGENESLTVITFHPDGDGPTDEDHPMLNRTEMSL